MTDSLAPAHGMALALEGGPARPDGLVGASAMHRRHGASNFVRLAVLVAYSDAAPASLIPHDHATSQGASVNLARLGAHPASAMEGTTIIPFVGQWPLSAPFESRGTMTPQPLELFSLKAALGALWHRLRRRPTADGNAMVLPQ